MQSVRVDFVRLKLVVVNLERHQNVAQLRVGIELVSELICVSRRDQLGQLLLDGSGRTDLKYAPVNG